jgi:hypothetical protein
MSFRAASDGSGSSGRGRPSCRAVVEASAVVDAGHNIQTEGSSNIETEASVPINTET